MKLRGRSFLLAFRCESRRDSMCVCGREMLSLLVYPCDRLEATSRAGKERKRRSEGEDRWIGSDCKTRRWLEDSRRQSA